MRSFVIKRQIDYRVRSVLLVALIVVSVVSSYLTYRASQLPDVVDVPVADITYAQKGLFGYSVSLRNNSLYDTKVLGSNLTYFTRLVDTVNTSFVYDFDIDRPAKVSGSYEASAIVSTDLWEKRFAIPQKGEFSGIGGGHFELGFPVNLSFYNQVVNEIGNEVGVAAGDPRLKLQYRINTVALADGREIKETYAPTILIPLGRGTFDVKGDVDGSSKRIITRNQQVVQEGVFKKRATYSKITIGTLTVLLLFAFMTEGRDTARRAAGIRKKYGDWIADARGPPVKKGQIAVPIDSFEDLVKVADELNKPVIHALGDGKHNYCVYDAFMRYEYQEK